MVVLAGQQQSGGFIGVTRERARGGEAKGGGGGRLCGSKGGEEEVA